jgi:hypothetical protein
MGGCIDPPIFVANFTLFGFGAAHALSACAILFYSAANHLTISLHSIKRCGLACS